VNVSGWGFLGMMGLKHRARVTKLWALGADISGWRWEGSYVDHSSQVESSGSLPIHGELPGSPFMASHLVP
jgi:hypothetical protein